MRLDLLGYLTGALDGPEKDRIHRALQSDPNLQAQLEQLEERLGPLESLRWEEKPPVGLAARTCQVVTAHAEKSKVQLARVEQTGIWSQVERSGWRMVDVVVVAGIIMAASMMFFPAIANSRHVARVQQCQDNMRLFGAAFPAWADRGDGQIPYIPSDPKTGVAGFYAPQLVEAGFMSEHNRFLCPSSDLAYERNSFVVPTINQIQSANNRKLVMLQRKMGGSYQYGLGHFVGNRHRATRMRGRAYFPVISDHVPSRGVQLVEGAHGSKGINILFENGTVRYLVLKPSVKSVAINSKDSENLNGLDLNSMFVSDRGLVEAGMSVDDVVLAPSWARPVPVTFVKSGSETTSKATGR